MQDLDVKIADIEAVLTRLDQEHYAADQELSTRITSAQRSSEEITRNVDKLSGFNRTIERYASSIDYLD